MKKDNTTPTRVFSAHVKKITDLYKLLVANMKKNTAQDGSPPDYVSAEHCHFFHTFTSDGQAQTTSSTIGGHFHIMELVKEGDDTTPSTYKCSPPMRYGMVKDKYGRKVRQMILANTDDEHTHEIVYMRSKELMMREKNTEAAKLHVAVASKYDQKVPGVQ